jgi:hypothetical protein
MEQKNVNPVNPDTAPDPEIENVNREQVDEKSSERGHDAAPDEAKEEIVIKQVPVDGICGGY